MRRQGGDSPQRQQRDTIEEAEALRQYQDAFSKKGSLPQKPKAFVKAGTLTPGTGMLPSSVPGQLYLPTSDRVAQKLEAIEKAKDNLERGPSRNKQDEESDTREKRKQLIQTLREYEARTPRPKLRVFKKKVNNQLNIRMSSNSSSKNKLKST